MNNKKYQEFCKRYDKFKKNNLPTPFFDDERNTYEYVCFNNDELEVYHNLTIALSDMAYTGFYYPFTDKHIESCFKDKKRIDKVVIGHNHAHFFEEVVRYLYYSPESFSISKDEEKYYSKQQLEYLRRIQKYLLFIGLKDLETNKIPVSRYRNKKYSKYKNIIIHTFDDTLINDILNKKRFFYKMDYYPEYSGDKIYKPHEYQALIVDKEDNFKMLIEYTKEEIKTYKEIKDINNNNNLKDDDKVILRYFKVLEIF